MTYFECLTTGVKQVRKTRRLNHFNEQRKIENNRVIFKLNDKFVEKRRVSVMHYFYVII